MMPIIGGFALTLLAMMGAGAALRGVHLAHRHHRDPRPYAATVFALVAFAIMQAAWSLSPSFDLVDDYYNAAWRAIDTILLLCILWLVIVASSTRKPTKKD